jgi:hypothetical protein
LLFSDRRLDARNSSRKESPSIACGSARDASSAEPAAMAAAEYGLEFTGPPPEAG